MTQEQLENYLINVQAATVALDEVMTKMEETCVRLSREVGQITERLSVAEAKLHTLTRREAARIFEAARTERAASAKPT